jgi:two-component system OmpR family sensor kinase
MRNRVADDDALDRPVRTGSLRRRVILAVLAVVLVVLVALGWTVNTLLGDRLRADARQQLTDRAAYAQTLAARGLTAQELTDGLTGQGVTAKFTGGGQTVVGRDQRPANGPPPGGRPGPRPSVTSTTPVTIVQNGPDLSVSLTVAGGTLQLTSSEIDIDRTLSILHNTELVAGAITLLVAGLLLIAIVRAALAPLNRMTELARRIRAGARGRRLRPTRPNTEIGRTAAAMDDMLDALESAETQAQDAETRMRQLLADVSHDLRTPIAGAIAAAEQLLRADPGRARREQLLVNVVREGQRAARLVDDLLLMAQLDDAMPGHGSSPVNLTCLVETAAERVLAGSTDRQVFLETATPVWVAGDADRLTRVVTNLLENARNATARNGLISVAVLFDGGSAVVRITDNGPGIPPGDQERIFDRFARLDHSRSTPGSGLGLPIARTIARSYGGEVRCVSSPDGARFELVLPALQLAPVG